jgi:hypothetical protein
MGEISKLDLSAAPSVAKEQADQAPKWAPLEHDYVSGDKLCPFSSSAWGNVALAAQQIGQRVMQVPAPFSGLTYVRCNRKCALFSAAADDNPDDKEHHASGSCSLLGRTT